MPGETVLVTGATGRIGRVVVGDLLERGYRIRATTSRTQPPSEGSQRIDWCQVDLAGSEDLNSLVGGCSAVLHLAAEIGKKHRMKAVNERATERLARAAEDAGVRAFCYTSTVAVYGSGRSVAISESSPVLSLERDVASEYWALDYVREYGRTKLAGERAIIRIADQMRCVVLRPAVVVDIGQIIGIRDWNIVKRMLASHRHAHHIYVGDVSDALIWCMERSLAGVGEPGQVDIYNLAEDDRIMPRHLDFMRKAFAASGDRRYRVVSVPWVIDWLHDFLRFHSLPIRNPLWRMRFSGDRLKAAGYKFKYGMAKAEQLALARLAKEAQADRRADLIRHNSPV
ncbi:NAD-dependent epimerase/dehydratase family protein (plasmid) [Rhizobium phaseoli]|uniref:NAD-dependent epimerase/dehydratase family protein n=1 Tax=Rhizobium phaseoli TaxID=396 RepID=UPI0002D5F1ED|nr:NAD-dependent epimerase/dehydratase family protein [Rhizobium phaseoli]ANL31785.1 NAD-dependent epimerase/dehydratase family protein [Rhizobium phaseoli]ARM16289.1 NAD-dependent epimerase/dehydratase family protein [Rhizobium phaseoli Brasil 5]KKZ84044.1 NAD-dependent epimerase/dehydratase [Rhizobium phaseoli Ch24-10]MDK4725510.1 NAD-dependent epimerase/dehydratase family protein [Rhizobium phaseoli]NKE89279.1 NAD-dependent epimerase/dehydratase family protein [Rhizobium phaseoli]